MKLQEAFPDIDLELMEDKAEENDYWKNAYNFVLDNLDRDVETLSNKQYEWLDRINGEM